MFSQAALIYRGAGKPTQFLKRVEDYWKNTIVRSITSGAVEEAAIKLYPNGSGATRNRAVIVPTLAVINYAAKLGRCERLSADRFPVERKQKEPVTWEWIQTFAANASPHLGALAYFMFLTGARIGEALALTWDDIDFPGRRALIRQTKIGEERWAHLQQPLVVALANIPDRAERVFKYTDEPGRAWSRAIRRAGLPYRSFHACRHGFATAMLHAGIDPITVAKRGGWRSPQHLFSTYGHALEDIRVTDAIVEKSDTNLAQSLAPKPKRGYK